MWVLPMFGQSGQGGVAFESIHGVTSALHPLGNKCDAHRQTRSWFCIYSRPRMTAAA